MPQNDDDAHDRLAAHVLALEHLVLAMFNNIPHQADVTERFIETTEQAATLELFSTHSEAFCEAFQEARDALLDDLRQRQSVDSVFLPLADLLPRDPK